MDYLHLLLMRMMLIFELWLFVDDCCDDDGEDYDYDLDERFAHARFVDAWARDNQSLNRTVFGNHFFYLIHFKKIVQFIKLISILNTKFSSLIKSIN